jgi:hypothetical protein
VGAQTELAAGLFGDRHLVPGQHFHVYSQPAEVFNHQGGIGAGWVKQGQNTEELPFTLVVGAGYPQGTVAPFGKVVDGALHMGGNFVLIFIQG